MSNITYIEISKASEKTKWIRRFQHSYSGGTNPIGPLIQDVDLYRFFEIIEGQKRLGFFYISRRTDWFENQVIDTVGDVWSLSVVYVKPVYRNQGVFTKALRYAVASLSVKMIYLELSRLMENEEFYQKLGFHRFEMDEFIEEDVGGSLLYLLEDSLGEAIEQRGVPTPDKKCASMPKLPKALSSLLSKVAFLEAA